jgi:hypothetical protein
MSIFQKQLRREAGWDVRVAIVWGIIFFGCGLILPRWTFWWWFTPIAVFWFRYLWVRCRRSEELLRADGLADLRSGTPRCYRSEAGICISDGTHHVLVGRQDAKPLLQLPHIVGRE